MLTSVELFAGAGGLGMGLSLTGFRHLGVVEWNRWACDTIRENIRRGHPLVAGWPLSEGDVRTFDYDGIAEPVDVLAGGPPCQPFSICGNHRAFLDARDMFPAAVDAVRRLRPRAFIMENVKGLLRETFSDYFAYIVLQLEFPEIFRSPGETWEDHLGRLQRRKASGGRSGLCYTVAFRLLNAADYGVPQKRERVFIVGFRDDLSVRWSPPHPTHSRAALLAEQSRGGSYWDRHDIAPPTCRAPTSEQRAPRDAEPRRAWNTVRDALAGLPDPERHPRQAAKIPDHRFQPGARFYAGHTGSPLDLPAKTLKAGDHGVPGGENALVRADGTGRYFTVREAARLQTFPDSYVLNGAWSEAMRQLGNAVPVTLAHAVGASVALTLRERDTKKPFRTPRERSVITHSTLPATAPPR